MIKKNINRKIKPEPSGEIEFKLPPVKEFTTSNGLKVLFAKKDKLPIVRFLLLVDAGSVYDSGKFGLANLTAMMLDEGAGGLNALQLIDEIDILGSHLNIRSDEDTVYISLQTLKENIERSFEIFSKVIASPHFDEKDFQREKRKALTRIIQRKDNPDEIADTIFELKLYNKENPYAHLPLGYESTVNSITINDIQNYYKNYFSPQNSALIVVGDTNEVEIQNLINKYLGNWKNEPAEHINISPPLRRGSRIIFCHKENAMQSEIRAGHLASKRNEGNFFARHLLNTILGGQFSSRINLNLREDKGYTYGAFSRFNYFKRQAHFYVSTSVSTENTGNAIEEILNELQKIREGITEQELDFAKSSVIRRFPSNFETYSQVATNLSGRIIFSLPEDYFDTYIDNIKNVTLDDVNREAVREILTEETLIAIVGDKNKAAAQLKNFPNSVFIYVDEEGNEI